MKKEILTDEPIDKLSDDLLNRTSFIENLASSLKNWNQEKSLVIGLFGKWGSGKSSIINLVENKLREDKEKLSKKAKKNTPIVVKFNPWGYSESDDLLEPFIRQLQSTLKGPDKIKYVSDKLELYLDILKLVPSKKDMLSFWSALVMILSFVGISLPQLFPGIANQIKAIANWVSPTALILASILLAINMFLSVVKLRNKNSKKSVSEIKKEISALLRNNKRKIIVIIDDIDRLSSNEIKQLFRIVRTNADFPNTIYLLSFDREIVEKSLDVQNRIDGRDYLEKIINIEYDLPMVSKFTLNKILINQLGLIANNFSIEENQIFEIENTKWSYVFNAILSNFTTIREIKRYINAINFKLGQYIKENVLEVNLIDFFAIEFIRLKFPKYYDFIRENKTWFITSRENLNYKLPNKGEEYDKWFEESFKNDTYSKNEIDCLDTILSQIFPAIRYCSKDVSKILAATTANLNDKYCSISSEKYFDIYFNHVQGIPQNECSNFDVQLIKNNSGDYNSLVELFRNYIKNNKSISLLKFLESCSLSGDFIKQENFISYFSALFDLLEEFPENNDFWSLGNKATIFRIYYFLIKDYDKDFNFNLLQEVMEKSKSIFMFIYILNLDKENLEKNNIQQMIITEEKHKHLTDLLIHKIENDKENIINSNYFNFILYYWKNNKFDTYKIYFDNLISTNEGFLNLLDKMIWNSKANIGTKIVVNKKFNYKSLANYLDLDKCKSRLDTIYNNCHELSEAHKETISIFYEYYDKRNNEFYI